MATWAEFERADPGLATFGRDRLDGHVCFHATLRSDGSPRVHPVEPWIAEGLLMVRFRGQSPKVSEVFSRPAICVARSDDQPGRRGGEFLVHGIMEPIPPDHPAASPIVTVTRVLLAFFALSVDEAVGTIYEGADRDPVYRRWRSEGA